MGDILRPVSRADRFGMAEVDQLLRQEGIRRDANLDYTCGIYDDDEDLVATGSCFGNTLRCLAVSGKRRGQGLLVQVVSHLLDVQARRGNLHVFVYTKPANGDFFTGLGFHEIARTAQAVFMENRRGGFGAYCTSLKRLPGQRIAAVVMNANPFTLGHRYLVERASRENDGVHLFVLSEENGPIPAAVRRRLVEEGVRDLENVVIHGTGPYLISSAIFPSYFLKDADEAIRAQAALDGAVFGKIAAHLGIQRRYLGEEKRSHVTAIYNKVLAGQMDCCVVPRLEVGGEAVSASVVRQAIHDGRLEEVRDMLPESTYRYFASAESEAVRAAIRREENVVHY